MIASSRLESRDTNAYSRLSLLLRMFKKAVSKAAASEEATRTLFHPPTPSLPRQSLSPARTWSR